MHFVRGFRTLTRARWVALGGTASLAMQVLAPLVMPGVQVSQAATTSPYPSAVLADQPAGYWRFDEASGTTANDASGHNLAGTYAGGVTHAVRGALPADSDTAVSLDGSSGRATIPDAASLRLSHNFSIEAWLEPTSVTQAGGNGWPRVLQKGTGANGAAAAGYILEVDSATGRLRTDIEGLSPFVAESSSTIPLNTWTHAVVTYDGANLRFYLNGVLDNTVPTTGSAPANSTPLTVGARADGSRYWQGGLDEVAIYDKVLSAARVQAHFAAASQSAPSPTPATGQGTVYWQGDFSTGNFSQWDFVQDGSNNAAANGNTTASVVTSPTPAGYQYAASLTDGPNTGTPHDAANLVLTPAHSHGMQGQDTYYGFSVYFPSSNRGKWAPNVWDFNNFFEFLGGPPAYGGPMLQMGVNTGDWGVTDPHLFAEWRVKQDGSGYADRAAGYWDLGAVPYDTWVNFVIHVNWQSSPTGTFELWQDGNLVTSKTSLRTLAPADAANGGQMEPQNYRPAWSQPTTVVFGAARIGDGYAAVAP